MAKEREATERAERKKQDEDDGKVKLEQESRDLRAQLDQLQDAHADLQASFADLQHEANQAVAKANSRQQRNSALQQEVDLLRGESEAYRAALTEEKQRCVGLEAVLEQEKLKSHSSNDSAIIREELHRKSAVQMPLSGE